MPQHQSLTFDSLRHKPVDVKWSYKIGRTASKSALRCSKSAEGDLQGGDTLLKVSNPGLLALALDLQLPALLHNSLEVDLHMTVILRPCGAAGRYIHIIKTWKSDKDLSLKRAE